MHGPKEVTLLCRCWYSDQHGSTYMLYISFWGEREVVEERLSSLLTLLTLFIHLFFTGLKLVQRRKLILIKLI